MAVNLTHIEIELLYLLKGETQQRICAIGPKAYFDPAYALSGRDAIYSEPRKQRVCDYLKTRREVVATNLVLCDSKLKLVRTLHSSYWDRMQSDLTECTDFSPTGKVTHRELILSQWMIAKGISGWQITRWLAEKQHWDCHSSAFVELLPDGTQEDHPQAVVPRSRR